ncbi:hypothetical protein BRD00_07080 [Halobacteriales archaeon QS_8_69_26]|nr:MAG: hypothetical protein BRD00_07080 [Halobacteriales archaeon QS_8_69_26]
MSRKVARTRAERGSRTGERSGRDGPTRAKSGSESESADRRVESLHRSAGNQAMQSADRGGTTSSGGSATVDRSPAQESESGEGDRESGESDTADRESEDGFETAVDRVMRSTGDTRAGGTSPVGDGGTPPGGTGGPTGGADGSGGSVEEVDPQTVRQKQRQGNVEVVDVRSPTSFRDGHVPGAKNVPLGEVARKPSTVGDADEVVSCCRSGNRSEDAARMIASEGGADRVLNMEGGYERWQREVGEADGSGGGGAAGTTGGTAGDGESGSQPALGDGQLQAKLSISQPGDRNEREAERVAEEVMKMDDPRESAGAGMAGGAAGRTVAAAGGTATASGAPTGGAGTAAGPTASCGGREAATCSECGEDLQRSTCSTCGETIQRACACEEELQRSACSECEDDGVQRSAEDGNGGGDVESKISAARKGGQPLSDETRSFFEPRFGADFSDVTVHTGSEADEAARAVDAEAFTVGTDVVFREGAYNPGTQGGKELLAHELTHVTQQNDVSAEGGGVQRQAAKKGGGGESEGVAQESRVTGSEPFLPLQISCLRQAGACGMGSMALPQLNEVCRASGFAPVPPTNYEGPDLTQEDLQCGTSLGKIVARTVDEVYSGWLSTLPDCPCTVEGAKQHGEFENTKGPWSENMHAGAEYDFRATGYSSVGDTHHGQQCMYDAAGQLITEGEGRGTPDVWGPKPLTYWPYHRAIDIVPSQDLSADEYRDIWTPNTGKDCASNTTGVRMEDGQEVAAGAGGAAAGGPKEKGGGGSGGGGSAGGTGGGSSGGCGSSGWEYDVDGCSVPDVATAKGGGFKGWDANVFDSANKPMGEDGVEFGAGGSSSDLPCDVHDRDYQTCKSEFDENKLSEVPPPENFDSHEALWQTYREAGALLVDFSWKEEADKKFEEGMKQQCAERYEGETAWFSDTPYEDCVETAEMYHAGVSDAFSDAYRKRQYQACTCELQHNPESVGVSEKGFWRNVPGVGEGAAIPW